MQFFLCWASSTRSCALHIVQTLQLFQITDNGLTGLVTMSDIQWHPPAHHLSINSRRYCLNSDTQTHWLLHWSEDNTHGVGELGRETLGTMWMSVLPLIGDISAQWHSRGWWHPRHSRCGTVADCPPWSYQLPFWASHFANSRGLGNCTFALQQGIVRYWQCSGSQSLVGAAGVDLSPQDNNAPKCCYIFT